MTLKLDQKIKKSAINLKKYFVNLFNFVAKLNTHSKTFSRNFLKKVEKIYKPTDGQQIDPIIGINFSFRFKNGQLI